MKYRPEIDGLRTIAVLSVLLYHAELYIGDYQLFAGGYLGVDIFFVISGYLITSLILTELRTTGKFSYLNFYERRARRLLPALSVVMLFALPIGWLVLLPTQLVDFSESLIASIFFVSNFYWEEALQLYGAESGLVQPFLHTWSLAVEEQYYLIFPFFMLAAHRYLSQHAVKVLTVFLVLSLLYSEWINETDFSFAFYMLPPRFWELLVGAILAHAVMYKPLKDSTGLHFRLLSALGILLVAYSVVFMELSRKHPGLITVLPVAGTALIIWCASARDSITRMLSSKGFVAIGLISYSLYLWHYPIFAFGRLIEPDPTLASKVIWFVLSFGLSWATYLLIERPSRNRSRLPLRPFLIMIGFSTLIVLGYAAYAIVGDGLRERFPILIEVYGKNEFDNAVLLRETWAPLKDRAAANGLMLGEYEHQELWFSSDDDTRKVLVVGNSHSVGIFNALYLNRELFSGLEFARYGMDVDNSRKPERLEKFLESPNFAAANIILISTQFLKVEGRRDDFQALPDFIELLESYGKKVLVSSNTVEFEFDSLMVGSVFDVYVKQTILPLKGEEFSVDKLNSLYFQKRNMAKLAINNDLIKSIADDAGVPYLDKQDYLCNLDDQRCVGITPDGYKTIADYGHLTIEGAKYFGQKMHQMNWLGLEADGGSQTLPP